MFLLYKKNGFGFVLLLLILASIYSCSGRINEDDLDKWSFIINYRNDIIHHNSISRKNKVLIHKKRKI